MDSMIDPTSDSQFLPLEYVTPNNSHRRPGLLTAAAIMSIAVGLSVYS
jgi:hypothetical protein